MPEIVRLNKELEKIEKNQRLLKLIELQYQKEIDRRNKKAERAAIARESGENVVDSPLRRAREYALSIANSPSPVKRLLKEHRGQSIDSDCSPNRCSKSPQKFSPAKYSADKLSPVKLTKVDDDESTPNIRLKRTSTLIKRKAT